MTQVPLGFVLCEEYRGFVIAVRGDVYCGFGVEMDTRNCKSQAEVRDRIDAMLA